MEDPHFTIGHTFFKWSIFHCPKWSSQTLLLHLFFCDRVAAESMCHPHLHDTGHDRTQAPGISSVVSPVEISCPQSQQFPQIFWKIIQRLCN